MKEIEELPGYLKGFKEDEDHLLEVVEQMGAQRAAKEARLREL